MPASQDATRAALDGRLFLAVVAAAVGMVVLRGLIHGGGPLFADTDDAMRMVVVRDLLAGQGWFDHAQYRLDTPHGGDMHWSRLVDLPLALLVLALRPLAGGMAETLAAWIWPLLLFVALIWVSARLVLRLVGREGVLAALVLPLLSPAVTAEFGPGRIDHHNTQVLLVLAIAWATIESLRRPGFAWLAGLFAATALAIATESLPAVAAAILAYGLVFVFSPQSAKQVRGFGLGFALATAGHFLLALPPRLWLQPACDALSIVYLVAALLAGGVLAGLASLPRLPVAPPARLAVGLGAGLAAVALVLALFPHCLAGPYAGVDPWLRHNWIDAITEARPWWRSLAELPAYALAVAIPPVLGLAVIAWRLRAGPEDRGEWLALALFLVVVTLVMLVQVRGARLVTMLAVPPAAWLIARLRARFLERRSFGTGLALLGAWTGFSGVVVVVLVSAVMALLPGAAAAQAARDGRQQCLVPAAFADLAALPPERIMAPVDLGAHMLLETPHAVVAAPYHRNQRAVRDTFDFFNRPVEQARAILTARGIGLVVVCPGLPEMRGFADAAPDSFVALRRADALPGWLVPVPGPGPLEIYAVLPGPEAR